MNKDSLTILQDCVIRVLGALVQNKELIYEYKLTRDDFAVSFAKVIFDAIDNCKGQVTRGSVNDYILSHNKSVPDTFIDNVFLSKDVEIENSVEVLKKHSKHRKLSLKLNSIVDEFQSMTPEKYEYKNILNRLSEIESDLMIQKSMKSMTMTEWIDLYKKDFEERKNGKRWKFNEEILDYFVRTGPVPGEGGLICAATGMGKSAYCLYLLYRLILAKIPVAYFTLEMGAISTMDRLLSSITQIPFKEIVDIKDYESWESIKNAIEKEANELKKVENLFMISEDPSISLLNLKQEIRKFQLRCGQEYCIVIVDLLTMVEEFSSLNNGAGLAQSIELAINKLNALSKEMGFHYIGVVQLNRTVESDKVHDLDDINRLKPTRSSIKNSGALLERARWCVSLFRPKYYADTYLEKEDSDKLDDVIEVGLLKANNSKTGKRHMMFDGDTFSLMPISNHDEDEETEEID